MAIKVRCECGKSFQVGDEHLVNAPDARCVNVT